ncbi:unnamed protein product [Phytophthora lilii]|uniref:ER membrane protein complex subunit 2 n=1 Tax=Phytophthora lilii TaxID=2077276 RepID=A0A9W6WRR2_9STRA|nr:unnamed protein product [Phytophthora lilii]
MQLEQRGEFAKALALYDELLETNPANALVLKRKIAVLKAQKKTADVVTALNEFLRNFGTDLAACWLYFIAVQIYSTIGGLDNLLTARKHYAHSIELNKKQNLRAYFALVACTKAIAAQRNYRSDQDDDGINERLQKFAVDYIQDCYATNASPDLAEIGKRYGLGSRINRMLTRLLLLHPLAQTAITAL